MRAWRFEQEPKLTLDAAAAGVGTTRQTWYDWESGRRIPERRFMVAVYRFTCGKVRPDDFYDLPDLSTRELPFGGDPAPAPLFESQGACGDEPQLQAAA